MRRRPKTSKVLFREGVDGFLAYMEGVRMVSPATLRAYTADLVRLGQFIGSEELSWDELSMRQARTFGALLAEEGLASNSVNRILSGVRRFYHYHWRMGNILSNPFDGVEGIKVGRRLPKVLHRTELETLIEGLNGEDFAGRRDRLLVELLYSTGCRISEAMGIELGQLGHDSLKVKGKGSKERIVFLGSSARKALDAYLPLRQARVERDRLGREPGALFLNQKGGRLSPRGAALILEKHARRFSLPGTLNPHTFRHSFATDLLDGGADIRQVQEMLGHASLSTTQVYTHLGIEALKQVHRTAHPHGREKRVNE